jgi:predicted metal-binding protein
MALKLGAVEAKQIPAGSVVTACWVRLKCQYGCGGYGQSLTCPPHSPRPEETAALLKEYRRAVLIHGKVHVDVTRVAVKLERHAFLDGYHKAFALGAGPCMLCRTCPGQNGKCRHPDQARPAMEACGIDVYQTARNNGYPIEVVKNERCPENYYSLLLLE